MSICKDLFGGVSEVGLRVLRVQQQFRRHDKLNKLQV